MAIDSRQVACVTCDTEAVTEPSYYPISIPSLICLYSKAIIGVTTVSQANPKRSHCHTWNNQEAKRHEQLKTYHKMIYTVKDKHPTPSPL